MCICTVLRRDVILPAKQQNEEEEKKSTFNDNLKTVHEIGVCLYWKSSLIQLNQMCMSIVEIAFRKVRF